MMPLLLVALALIAGSAQSSAGTPYPCNGTWNGTVGPGTGTVNVLAANHPITTTSTVTGTFSGDTTHGTWAGTINTNYTVPDLSAKGQVSNAVSGTYVMNIDPSGTITGTSTIPLSGQFSGQFTITFQGQESPTGGLTGTWTGTLTVTQVTYNMLPLGANITAPGSGQFTGSAQVPAAQTGASTSSSVPTTVAAVSTIAAGASSTSAMVSATAQSATQSSGQSVSSLPYLLAAVVVVIVIVGALALKMKRPKKAAG